MPCPRNAGPDHQHEVPVKGLQRCNRHDVLPVPRFRQFPGDRVFKPHVFKFPLEILVGNHVGQLCDIALKRVFLNGRQSLASLPGIDTVLPSSVVKSIFNLVRGAPLTSPV